MSPFIKHTDDMHWDQRGSVWTQSVDQDGTSFADWTAASGTWSSASSVIKQTDTAAIARRAKYNTAQQTAGLVMQAGVQLRTATAGKYGGILLGFDGTNTNGILVRITEGDALQIERDGIGTSNVAFTVTIAVNTWYTVKAVAFGNMVSAYVDGVLIGTAYLLGTSQVSQNNGFVGLYTFAAEVWFRNIEVWTFDLPV